MNEVFPKGSFAVGCNYWASHAGMMMWRRWDAERVARDLDALSENGLSVLRVFPLWPDFQPLTAQYGGGGEFRAWALSGWPSETENAFANAGASFPGALIQTELCRDVFIT